MQKQWRLRWKLDEVMVARGITNQLLADELELTVSAVSRRRKKKMPRLDGCDLLSLVMAIERISGERCEIGDLIEVKR